ncbi:MAG: transposase [Leptolyngbyaceae bacterium]|nr:transposase [Leptolyngbyaceae bacterium]
MPIVAGCDVGKTSLDVCVLSSEELQTINELKKYARKYKPLKITSDAESIELLKQIECDCFVLEPTGSYTYLWMDIFDQYEIPYRLVSPMRVRNYAKYKGMVNKSDRNDCVAIAAYSLEEFHKSRAFLGVERLNVRELFLSLNATTRSRNPTENRLGQRLQRECPELEKTYKGMRRRWLQPAPTLLLEIAGIEHDRHDPYKKSRDKKINESIGKGFSSHTRDLARHLIQFYDMELKLEEQLDAELRNPAFAPYHEIFDRFKMPNRIRAALLSRIYPIDDFLGDDRKPIIEYVEGKNGQRSKRDRSEAAFKLSLGLGKSLYQSGIKTSWKKSGSAYARTALWGYVTTVCKMSRKKANQKEFIGAVLEPQFRPHPQVQTSDGVLVQPWENERLVKAVAEKSEEPIEVSKLRLHYEFQAHTKIADQRVMNTASKACRMLYKELIKIQ